MRFDSILFTILFQYSFLQVSSSITLELNECSAVDSVTIDSSTTNNQGNSCDINCCTESSLSSDLCQVTVKSLAGDCLSRFCYSNRCDQLTFLVNKTYDKQQNQMKTIINRIGSSFSNMHWSSLLNTTETKFFSFIDQTGLTQRHRLLILLVCLNILLTFMTLIIVIKSIQQANNIAEDKSHRYALL